MTDLLLQIGVSKLAVSVALACVAWVVQRRAGPSPLSWALWLLLLAGLLTPPLVPVPVFSPGVEPPASIVFGMSPQAPATPTLAVSAAEWLSLRWKEALAFLWLSGIAVVAAWSLIRTLRFHRHLQEGSTVAPAEVQRIAGALAETLGLASAPTIHFTKAHVAPLVWWMGGRPRVVVPSILWRELDRSEVRCILAHELAHVRRRDHIVRWIEWLACTVFWWNPLAWWARRRLRAAEEFCCDALVSAALASEPQVYARSLLRTIELMSTTPAIRPPTLASTADGGQRVTLLAERLRMIMRHKPTPVRWWLQGAARVVAPLLLVASLVYCTDRAGPTSADAARTPVERDAAEDHTGVREILSTWLDRLTLADDLDGVGSELDSPWARQMTARVLTHLDVLLAEGPEGPDAEALGAAFEGRRLPDGASHYFVIVSRAAEGGQDERVVVDLARLREALAGTDMRLSQKDLEAVIRRSAAMKRAGWTFKAMAGFSGEQRAHIAPEDAPSINSTVMATDVDGDGNVDLVVGRIGERALLDAYRNDGLGRFVRH